MEDEVHSSAESKLTNGPKAVREKFWTGCRQKTTDDLSASDIFIPAFISLTLAQDLFRLAKWSIR